MTSKKVILYEMMKGKFGAYTLKPLVKGAHAESLIKIKNTSLDDFLGTVIE